MENPVETAFYQITGVPYMCADDPSHKSNYSARSTYRAHSCTNNYGLWIQSLNNISSLSFSCCISYRGIFVDDKVCRIEEPGIALNYLRVNERPIGKSNQLGAIEKFIEDHIMFGIDYR